MRSAKPGNHLKLTTVTHPAHDMKVGHTLTITPGKVSVLSNKRLVWVIYDPLIWFDQWKKDEGDKANRHILWREHLNRDKICYIHR